MKPIDSNLLSSLASDFKTVSIETVRETEDGPIFDVQPMFSRMGARCDPAMEMLSVSLLCDGAATPMDCVPLRAFPGLGLSAASEKLRQAYRKAYAALDVSYRQGDERTMPGWDITTTIRRGRKRETLHLDFVREGLGIGRVNEVLRNRTREHAHQDLKLNLGPDHWGFCVANLRPW